VATSSRKVCWCLWLDALVFMWQDFTDDPIIISFAKNGEDLGTCFSVALSDLDGQPLFPHVLTKNCSFECNFGQMVDTILLLLLTVSASRVACYDLTLLVKCREELLPRKKLSDEVLAWLLASSEVRMICIWSSCCNSHPIISCFIKMQQDLSYWCQITQLSYEKGHWTSVVVTCPCGPLVKALGRHVQ